MDAKDIETGKYYWVLTAESIQENNGRLVKAKAVGVTPTFEIVFEDADYPCNGYLVQPLYVKASATPPKKSS